MPPIAMRIAYVGTRYRGYQRQPGGKTVEDQLEKALRETGTIKSLRDAGYSCSGRTDRGSHAICQIVRIETEMDEPGGSWLSMLNFRLPRDIVVLGARVVPETFDPRRDAVLREYTYYQPKLSPLDLDTMRKGAELLIGTHSFHNFSKAERGRCPVRTIYGITIEDLGAALEYRIRAKSFLWKMVRKIVTALHQLGTGRLGLEEVKKMLEPGYTARPGLEPQPPQGLVLTRVEYPGVFIPVDIAAEKRFKKYLFSEVSHGLGLHLALQAMLKKL